MNENSYIKRSTRVLVGLMLIAGQFISVHAQGQTSQPTNMLMRMMMSEPDVDITSRVVAVSSFDPPQVRPGEKAIYRVTFNALQSAIHFPGEIPSTWGLKFRLSAHEQMLRPGDGKFAPMTTFNFDVRASQAGLFTVPSFIVEVYGKPVVVPEADLEALDEPPADHQPARQLAVETGATNVFYGETLNVRALSPSMPASVLMGLTWVRFEGEGLLVNRNATRQTAKQANRNGTTFMSFIAETTLTPIASGQIAISAHGFAILNEQSKASAVPPQQQYLLLDSDPVMLNVRPLPVEGRLPGFAGAVGSFSCDTPLLTTNIVPVGEPVQLSVVIRGEGDLTRLVPPAAPRAKDWQIFDAVHGGLVAGANGTNPGVILNYTLIPLSDETRATPAIPFSYFDPKRAEYMDLTVPPVSVTVLESDKSENWESPPGFTDRAGGLEKKPALGMAKSPGKTSSSLVPLQLRHGFLFAQMAPALAFSGLWFWSRRRRFLELHPEIVRRRMARRELRKAKRSLRRAVARADAASVARYAVRAMQITSAPHYPAHPEALVCGDVLNVLDAETSRGRPGEIVRIFFAAADASRFSVSDQGHANLLNLRTEFDELLAKLEERL